MKKLISLFVILAFLFTLVPAQPTIAESINEDTIYGITNTGEIHKVNPYTGGFVWVASVDACPVGGSGPNGLAYDQNTNRIFYTNYPTAAGVPTNLYYIDLGDGMEYFVGELEGEIANADFYNGHYYYIAGGTSKGFTDDLYKVPINPDGNMGAPIKYENISGTLNKGYGFWGDIAIQDGIIYGVGSPNSGQNFEFFRVNHDGTDFKIIDSVSYPLQLAFGLDGVLYGHNFIPGDNYKVTWDETSVNTEWLSKGAGRYTDLASGKTSTETELYEICGYKYEDRESDLIGLEDWKIILEKQVDQGWEEVGSTLTDEYGKYCFFELKEGTYRVSEKLEEGWEQVYPQDNHIVVLPGGETYLEENTILYGTQRNNPSNNGLYEINLDTKIAARLFNSGGSVNSPNALGFDPENKRLYYMKVSEQPPFYSNLYFYDIEAGTETVAGLNISGQVIVGASFYDGAYYYIPNLTADLHRVSLNPDGAASIDTVLWTNFNGDNPAVYRFGDFAINRDGMLYASTNDTGGSTAEFFELNVLTGEYVLIADASTPNAALLLQVSFGSDGTLYGHAAGTGEFFTIDLTTGIKTLIGYVESDLRTKELFSDLASGTQPKYYNFINVPKPAYEICGYKYADWKEEMIPLLDWEITLKKWNDELESPDYEFVTTITTGVNGQHCFTDLEEGTYKVSENLKDGWDQVYPEGDGVHIVTLPGQASDPVDGPFYNFVNEPKKWCGDETAWAAQAHPGQTRFVDRGNWATYVTVNLKDLDDLEEGYLSFPLYAGQHYLAGMLNVKLGEGNELLVQYTTPAPQKDIDHCLGGGGKAYSKEGFCGDWIGLLEYHLHVVDEVADFNDVLTYNRRTKEYGNPIPGQFDYKGYFDPAKTETDWIPVDIKDFEETIPFYIAAHAVMQWCGYDCDALAEIEAAITTYESQGTFQGHPSYYHPDGWGYDISIIETKNGDFLWGNIELVDPDGYAVGAVIEEIKHDYNYWSSRTPNLAAVGSANYLGDSYNFMFLYAEGALWMGLSGELYDSYWGIESIYPSGLRDYNIHSTVYSGQFPIFWE